MDSVLSLNDRLPIEERPDELDNVRFRIIRWEMEKFEFASTDYPLTVVAIGHGHEQRN